MTCYDSDMKQLSAASSSCCVSANFTSIAWWLLKSICCTCSASPTYNRLVVYINLRYVFWFTFLNMAEKIWKGKRSVSWHWVPFFHMTGCWATRRCWPSLGISWVHCEVWTGPVAMATMMREHPGKLGRSLGSRFETGSWCKDSVHVRMIGAQQPTAKSNPALCSYVEWYKECVKSLEKSRSSDDRLQAMTPWAFAVWRDVWVDRCLNHLTVDSIQPGTGTASGHHACGNPKLPRILHMFEVLQWFRLGFLRLFFPFRTWSRQGRNQSEKLGAGVGFLNLRVLYVRHVDRVSFHLTSRSHSMLAQALTTDSCEDLWPDSWETRGAELYCCCQPYICSQATLYWHHCITLLAGDLTVSSETFKDAAQFQVN